MKKILIILIVLLSTISSSQAMTIEEAYKAIPHRQTVFDADTANMSKSEKVFLTEFFYLVDLAMVERVQNLQDFSLHNNSRVSLKGYDNIIRSLKKLKAPAKLENVKSLVLEAVEAQSQAFVNFSVLTENNANFYQSSQVQKAHSHLIQAYNILMKTYPTENSRNKQAFFDYLCALDFI